MSRGKYTLLVALLWASLGAQGCAMEVGTDAHASAESTEVDHHAMRVPEFPAFAPFPFGEAGSVGDGDGEVEDEPCIPHRSGWVKAEVRGCWGVLPESRVQLWSDEVMVETGRAFTWLPADDCPFDMVLIAALADRPTLRLDDLAIDHEGESLIERWDIPTGRLRVRAVDVDGRRVIGVARIHRVGLDGRAAPDPSGTIATNFRARELTSGTFELRLPYRGGTLAGRVTVGACQHRCVTLRPVD